MTPAEIRAATRDGILDAVKVLVYVAVGAVAVDLCVRYPWEALTELGPLAAGFGLLWALFALADSKRPARRFIGGLAWKGVGYAVLLGLICLLTRWLEPAAARQLAQAPAQLWRSTTR